MTPRNGICETVFREAHGASKTPLKERCFASEMKGRKSKDFPKRGEGFAGILS